MPTVTFALPRAPVLEGAVQHLDRSPTNTPAPTRAGSPLSDTGMPHTSETATALMTSINRMATPQDNKSAATDTKDVNAAQKPGSVEALPQSVGKNEHGKLPRVSFLDGSARVAASTKFKILFLYFMLNLGLTLYNKAVMIEFPYPFLLTALHAAAGIIGTQIMLFSGYFTLRNLSGYHTAILLAFSVLYTANIAVSNVSLAMVSIPFHQTVRALTPVFTITIYRVVYLSVYRTLTYITVVPIILGVMLVSYGDYSHTFTGFLLTLLGTILAAVKTVTTNRLQTAGLHLNALELLYRMSIFAFGQSLIMAYLTNEVHNFSKYSLAPGSMTPLRVATLLANSVIAFGLNVISFEANKKSGALTMTIAANVKQVLTVVFAVMIWHIRLSAINASGIVLALAGGAWYAYVELMGIKVTKAQAEGEV